MALSSPTLRAEPYSKVTKITLGAGRFSFLTNGLVNLVVYVSQCFYYSSFLSSYSFFFFFDSLSQFIKEITCVV